MPLKEQQRTRYRALCEIKRNLARTRSLSFSLLLIDTPTAAAATMPPVNINAASCRVYAVCCVLFQASRQPLLAPFSFSLLKVCQRQQCVCVSLCERVRPTSQSDRLTGVCQLAKAAAKFISKRTLIQSQNQSERKRENLSTAS